MLTFNISWKRKRAQRFTTYFVYKKQQVAWINSRVLTPAAMPMRAGRGQMSRRLPRRMPPVAVSHLVSGRERSRNHQIYLLAHIKNAFFVTTRFCLQQSIMQDVHNRGAILAFSNFQVSKRHQSCAPGVGVSD
jgi:hypothetical protein